jgi:hypothetical protein
MSKRRLDELKELCGEVGLLKKGKKSEVVGRLLLHFGSEGRILEAIRSRDAKRRAELEKAAEDRNRRIHEGMDWPDVLSFKPQSAISPYHDAHVKWVQTLRLTDGVDVFVSRQPEFQHPKTGVCYFRDSNISLLSRPHLPGHWVGTARLEQHTFGPIDWKGPFPLSLPHKFSQSLTSSYHQKDSLKMERVQLPTEGDVFLALCQASGYRNFPKPLATIVYQYSHDPSSPDCTFVYHRSPLMLN